MHLEVEQTKRRSGWSVKRTLAVLGISRRSYYRWLKEEAAPSPDGDCHACYNGKTNWGRCLFLGGVS